MSLASLSLSVALVCVSACGLHRGPASAVEATRRVDDQARAERVARLGGRLGADLPQPTTATFGLSSRSGLGAWTWPNGRVRVTPDLVDLLDDDELAAALAHEIGHASKAGSRSLSPGALGGNVDGVEQRADLIGCRLLAERGLPPQAMAAMLRKVASRLDASGRFDARIAAAERDCTGPFER